MREKKITLKKIGVLGAGAVGAYLIWGLSKKEDLDFCVIAGGERKERLQKNGFVINGQNYFPKVLTPDEARGLDLLIVSLKYNALPGALPDIAKAVDGHTVIMSLMNGVDSEETIGQVINSSQIVYSLIKIASERVGNHIQFDPEKSIGMIYGEKDASAGWERVEALNELFSGTGLHYRVSDKILSEIWSKFRLNVPNNQTQAMIGCGVGAYLDSEHAEFIRQQLQGEVEAIAKAKGIELATNDTREYIQLKRARYSTLQDLDAGRHTEVDMFAGTVVRMGKELGIPTPYNEIAYHLIKALEEKNDGLFDYEA